MSLRSSTWSTFEGDDASAESRRSSKHLRWLALTLETLGGLLVIVIASYLRIANLHPSSSQIDWHIICNDTSLLADKAADNHSIFPYALVIVIPAAFILVAEIQYTLFSKASHFDGWPKMKRISTNIPRIVRITGMFILGLTLSSFTADYLKILILRPRPFFLTLYGGNCPLPYSGTITDDFFDGLKSFPSHLAVVAGFTSFFAIGYIHRIRTSGSTPALTPIVTHAFLLVALTVSLDRYTSHQNHLSDVAAGFLIGLFLGFYMSSFVSLLIRPSMTSDQEDYSWLNIFDFMLPRVSLPPTRSANLEFGPQNPRQRQISNV